MNMDKSNNSQSLLLRLPLELRLAIYEYLLLPSKCPSTAHSVSVTNLLPDFHTYYSSDTNEDPFTLSVRTIDPWLSGQGGRSWRRRSTYHVRTGPFLTTTTPTTYRILLSPYTSHLRHTIPSLLSLNRQIHAEASKILYSTYTFNFHTNIEAAVPFLSDLTAPSRSSIRHIAITKKALPYTKEFDRAEWASLCTYLSSALILRTLKLNIIAGKPREEGWENIIPITAPDFDLMMRMRKEWGSGKTGIGGVDLEWVEQLMAVTGLKDMRVKALVEHCPTPRSDALAFWVAFSKSVEEGAFGEWVRRVMVSGG